MAITKANLLGVGLGHPVQINALATEIETEVDTDCAVVTAAFGAADTTNLATASAYAIAGDTINTMSGVEAAGTTITDALDITAAIGAVLVSYGASNAGIQLPVPTAGRKSVFVLNAGGNTGGSGATIKIYPPSSTTQIDFAGGGTAVTLASGKSALFMAIDTSGNYMSLRGA